MSGGSSPAAPEQVGCKPDCEKLFVYGTLAPDCPNEHILKPLGGDWQPAYVHGRLLDQGWGSDQGYPALALDPNGPKISGMVLDSANLPAFLPELDAFEGTDYQRVLADVALDKGAVVVAFVYVLADTMR